MILGRCDFFDKSQNETDYRVRMLLDNKINGLLPVSHRMINGESKYYYEINSLQSMDRVYAKDELDHQQLCSLLKGCIRLYDALEEYLLDGSQIILKPEFIYLNMDSLEPYFVYYPYYENDARDSFAAFIEDLLRKVDHTDEQAVMLAYQVYRYTRNQNYVLNEIMQMLQNVPENYQEVNEVKQDIICKEENYDDWDSISSYQSAYTTDNEENAEETKMQVGAESKDFKGAVICLVLAAGAVQGIYKGAQHSVGKYGQKGRQLIHDHGYRSMPQGKAVNESRTQPHKPQIGQYRLLSEQLPQQREKQIKLYLQRYCPQGAVNGAEHISVYAEHVGKGKVAYQIPYRHGGVGIAFLCQQYKKAYQHAEYIAGVDPCQPLFIKQGGILHVLM